MVCILTHDIDVQFISCLSHMCKQNVVILKYDYHHIDIFNIYVKILFIIFKYIDAEF